MTFEILIHKHTHTQTQRAGERGGDLVGLHFVAFGRDNGERARSLRNCAEVVVVRKKEAEPRNGI